MKKGQIILSAIALTITVASSFAFKASNKSSGHRLYTLTGTTCTAKNCFTTTGAGAGCGIASTITLRTTKDGGSHCATKYLGSRTTNN